MIDSDAIRELIKASFGGDRSAAGRYAAQQRWKNQTKKVKEIAPSLIQKDKKMFDDVVKRLMNESTLADLYFGASPSWYRQLFFIDRMELISKDPEVHNAKTIKQLIRALRKYEEPTENEKQNATKLGRNLSELSKPATSLRSQVQANPYVTEDELKKRYADGIIYDIANSWSQDPSYVASMAMKLAIQDEFGLSTEGKKEPKAVQDQLDTIREGVMNGPSVFYPTVLRKAVRAIYDATQERIKATMENGTTHIRLYRGTKVDPEGSESQGLIRSLTSWTPLVESAKKFEAEKRGGQPIVLVADVPINQIFATGMLGFGYAFEKEVVVLGPKVDVVKTLDFTVKDLGKASFGGDRSAAGRYAAEQRWKGHTPQTGSGKGKGSKFTNPADDAKFKKKYGNERMTGDGDCFEAAVRVMFEELTPEERSRAVICHGVPLGQGEIEGIRFDHAWVEVADEQFPDAVTVLDYSNGREIQIPREVYYAIGKIKSDDVKRFTMQEATEQMNEKGFYGPWD